MAIVRPVPATCEGSRYASQIWQGLSPLCGFAAQFGRLKVHGRYAWSEPSRDPT